MRMLSWGHMLVMCVTGCGYKAHGIASMVGGQQHTSISLRNTAGTSTFESATVTSQFLVGSNVWRWPRLVLQVRAESFVSINQSGVTVQQALGTGSYNALKWAWRLQ